MADEYDGDRLRRVMAGFPTRRRPTGYVVPDEAATGQRPLGRSLKPERAREDGQVDMMLEQEKSRFLLT